MQSSAVMVQMITQIATNIENLKTTTLIMHRKTKTNIAYLQDVVNQYHVISNPSIDGFESLGRQVFSFFRSQFHIIAEPEEVAILKGKTFVATLAERNARRLGHNMIGSNASNGSITDRISSIPPHALEMGDNYSIT